MKQAIFQEKQSAEGDNHNGAVDCSYSFSITRNGLKPDSSVECAVDAEELFPSISENRTICCAGYSLPTDISNQCYDTRLGRSKHAGFAK